MEIPGGTSLSVPANIQKAATTLHRLELLQKMFKQIREKPTVGMQHAEEAKYVTWTFSPEHHRKIELLHVTDVQWGHILCKVARVREYLNWVLDQPYRFILLGGDNIDAGTKISVGSPWEQLCEPQGQVYTFCEEFARVRHRILGCVGGNHERRGVPTFGDLGRLIAFVLQIPYSSGQQFIDINFGSHKPFKVALWHGSGSAVTPGAKMQMLHRFMLTGDSQLYLVGHLHDAMLKFSVRNVRVPGQNRVVASKYAGAMSSSFLDYFGSYAEVFGLPPTDLNMARATIFQDGRWELAIR